jgi:hypothetical protein
VAGSAAAWSPHPTPSGLSVKEVEMPPEEQHEHDPQYEAPTTWVCSICGRSFGLGSEFEVNISMQRKHEEYHLKDMIDDLEELLGLEAAINV